MAKTDYVNVDVEMHFMEERCSKHGCQLSESQKVRGELEKARGEIAGLKLEMLTKERDSARALLRECDAEFASLLEGWPIRRRIANELSSDRRTPPHTEGPDG